MKHLIPLAMAGLLSTTAACHAAALSMQWLSPNPYNIPCGNGPSDGSSIESGPWQFNPPIYITRVRLEVFQWSSLGNEGNDTTLEATEPNNGGTVALADIHSLYPFSNASKLPAGLGTSQNWANISPWGDGTGAFGIQQSFEALAEPSYEPDSIPAQSVQLWTRCDVFEASAFMQAYIEIWYRTRP